MKKIHLFFALAILLSGMATGKSFAVTAYPKPVEITQRDGTKITVILQGDERLKWAKSLDGYALIHNSTGVYEYAKLNASGDMVPSGVKAHNVAARTLVDFSFLSNTPKNLTFSASQVSIMIQVKRNLKSGGPQPAFPTSGTRKLLCILIEFTDLAFTKTQTDFQNLYNQVGYSVDGATGSIRDFFLESSYNKLNLSVDVAGPFVASNTQAYFGANDGNGDDIRPRELVAEAVSLANPSVNYADYDNDGDGSVDGVYLIYAGHGEEAGGGANAIWAHAWGITPVSCDGKTISLYSCSCELRGESGTDLTRIGVICHEFGHVLGAPDFYDTNYSTGGQYSGTGNWDLQAGGSWNGAAGDGATPAQPNPYTKIYIYNWATATTLTTQTSLTLQDAARFSNSFYRINTTTTGEYYLMENRQQVGFDTFIPGHGLLIYHVHGSIGMISINTTYPQKMYPVCANAAVEPSSTPDSYGTINGGGCPFPGTGSKTSFTDATLPSQKSWAGALTEKPITNITENNSSKTVSLCFKGCSALDDPTNFTSSVNSSQIDLAWNKNGAADNVMIAFSTTSPIFGTPVNGITYNVSDAIPGNGTVIYIGSLNSFTHKSLLPYYTYFYKAWSVLAGSAYSPGVITNATNSCGAISVFPHLQNFDDPTFPPSCWATFRGINGFGTGNDWARLTSAPYRGTGAAYIKYEAVAPGEFAQDWLATPQIEIPTGVSTSLSFYQRKEFSDNYPTNYYVKVSTTSQTDIISYTTTIANYDETSLSTVYTLNTIDLSAFAGQHIYVAFVMQQNDGDSWMIDNVSVSTKFAVNAKVNLEGAMLGSVMEANINARIPHSQPYGNVAPFLHTGTEFVVSMPGTIVDWVLVELRQATSAVLATSGTVFAKKAGLLKTDGTIVDVNGTSPLTFNNAAVAVGNNLYVVIRHRNHLPVMSNTGAILNTGVYSFDFRTGLGQAYGGASGYKAVGTSWAMVTGDITNDGNIFVTDYNSWATAFGITNGYYAADLNLDSNVFVTDYNKWATNFGMAAQTGIKSGILKPRYFSCVPK